MGDAFMSRMKNVSLVQTIGDSIVSAMSQKASTDNFALKTHLHNAKDINTGVLTVSQGGTGSTNFYEKGYWTPYLSSNGARAPSGSYGYRYGVYYRIGDLVYIAFHIKMNIDDAGEGYACIKGLPYTCSTGTDKYSLSLVEEYNAINSGDSDPKGIVVQNSNQIDIRGHSGAFAMSWITGTDQYIGYSGCYIKA